MKRTCAVLTALSVLLVCFAPSFSARNCINDQASVATKPDSSEFQAERPSLKIVLRGLMVFHPDPARQYFEVGVLKAPEHKFTVQVLENSPEGVSSFFVPLAQSGFDVLSLEFPSLTSGASFYQNGSFDRKSGAGDERDFRWIIDLRSKEFFDRELQIDRNQLGVVLHVTSSEFYTNKRTPTLLSKKGDAAFEYFGRAAQEVATDVNIAQGDMVLRSEKAGTEILRLKQKANTTYEVIIDNAAIPQEHMTPSANHFQYYYQLFAIPKAEWFDFKPAEGSTLGRFANHRKLSFVHANYLGSTDIPCMPVSW